MITQWKYAENTFEVVTRSSFKLMNIIITDHLARCTQLSASNPAVPLLSDALLDATASHGTWQGAYTAWQTSRGLYKSASQGFHAGLEELSSLKIRQWDAGIQGVFLEGTPEYTALLPRGREPFQKGAFDQRVSTVRALSQTLGTFAALATLKTQVDTWLTGLEALRQTQQQRETAVDTLAAALETQRLATAKILYKNLARFMLVWWENPVRIEDGFDMNYIRDGVTAPPEDEPPVP